MLVETTRRTKMLGTADIHKKIAQLQPEIHNNPSTKGFWFCMQRNNIWWDNRGRRCQCILCAASICCVVTVLLE
jgi:hypothetical protein